MSTKTVTRSRSKRGATKRKRKRRSAASASERTFAVVTVAAVIAGVGAMLYFGSRSPSGGDKAPVRAAGFTLPATDGSSVSLSDYRGKDVLLYFNEGVGCDACFYQMVEIEKHAQEVQSAGLTVLPIVVNPAPDVQSEMARFGLRTPYLIDSDTSVTQQFGMLGTGMHANLPGHGFVLIDGSGQVRWTQEYPSMYVSTDELLTSVRPLLP